ncbi:MAG TPA: hypothetical protein VLE89_05995 [Chlamydiales bacterium]|nr:hypothetical protein [Chlamydiales bacterium]
MSSLSSVAATCSQKFAQAKQYVQTHPKTAAGAVAATAFGCYALPAVAAALAPVCTQPAAQAVLGSTAIGELLYGTPDPVCETPPIVKHIYGGLLTAAGGLLGIATGTVAAKAARILPEAITPRIVAMPASEPTPQSTSAREDLDRPATPTQPHYIHWPTEVPVNQLTPSPESSVAAPVAASLSTSSSQASSIASVAAPFDDEEEKENLASVAQPLTSPYFAFETELNEAIAQMKWGEFGDVCKGWLNFTDEENAVSVVFKIQFILLLNQIRKSTSYKEFCKQGSPYLIEIHKEFFTPALYDAVKAADVSQLHEAYDYRDNYAREVAETLHPLCSLYNLSRWFHNHSKSRLYAIGIHIGELTTPNKYQSMSAPELERELESVFKNIERAEFQASYDGTGIKLRMIARSPAFGQVSLKTRGRFLYVAAFYQYSLVVYDLLRSPLASQFTKNHLGETLFQSCANLDEPAVELILSHFRSNKISANCLKSAFPKIAQTFLGDRPADPQAQIAILKLIENHPCFTQILPGERAFVIAQGISTYAPEETVRTYLTGMLRALDQ